MLEIGGKQIAPGSRRVVEIPVAQNYRGATVSVPARVWRAEREGPTVLVLAAVHGDEINGTGTVRQIMLDQPFEMVSGSLILVPVVNILGFERHSRYLPDRRDLNRCFPGDAGGSRAARYAHAIFSLVEVSDFVIDLHSATVRRTNFPNIRADMSDPGSARIARAFGCELVIDGKGPLRSLRRSATRVGHPTIILEAGEALKFEPMMVESGVRGIRNVLIDLGMVEGKPKRPVYQAVCKRTRWVRASNGGLLQFHVAPGDVIEKGQPITTTTSLLGKERDVILAPFDGVVMGMTTLPAVAPGDPVCHLVKPIGGIGPIREAIENVSAKSLHERARADLTTNIVVTEREEDD